MAWIEEAGVWALTSYALAPAVLNSKTMRNFLGFASGHDLSDADAFTLSVRWATVLSAHGDHHQRLRPLFASLMIPKNITLLQASTERTAHKLIDAVEARGHMDLMNDFGLALPFEVLSDLLCMPEEIRAQGLAWTAAISEGIKGVAFEVYDPAVMKAANDATEQLNACFADLIATRRRDPGEDYLDQMIKTAAKIGITDEELCANAWLLYIGGHETTGSTIGTSILRLHQNPATLARVKADSSLLPAVANEALRYDAAGFATGRISETDSEVGGQLVRAGEKIVVFLAAANHDPERFPNPDRFDIDRPDNKPLTFGSGPHLCAGQLLAKMNIRIALEVLHQRLPYLRLDDIDPPFNPCLTLGLPSLAASWR